MIAEKHIQEHLAKTNCHKCGNSLADARLTPISKAPAALIAHTTCSNCLAESVVTISFVENTQGPGVTDLSENEAEKFLQMGPTTFDEVFDIHKSIRRKTIWKLLQKKEQSLVKEPKKLDAKNKSQQ